VAIFIFATAVLSAVAAVSGCDTAARGKTTIRFWNGFTGPDGRTMLHIVQQFNRENPDVRVLMQRMPWATYYNKLFVAGLGGRAPEVFVVHAANIERFMQADFLRPVDDLVRAEDGIDEIDFAPNVWKAVERDGRHYAVPLDVHPLGMYYNKSLLLEAGMIDSDGRAKPPATREEFVDAVTKIAALPPGPDGRPRWGFVFTWFRTNIYTVMRQFGGRFFTGDNSRCVMNCPENVEALQFCVDLIQTLKAAPSPENFDSWIGFRQGRVGVVFEGIYMLADLKKQTDLDWGAAPVPLLDEHRAAWADSHTLCLKTDMDETHGDAAWRFVRFLSDNSLDWAEGGQVPARTSLRNTERFRDMYAQSEFARELPYITYLPQVPFIFEFEAEFDIAVEKALRGTVTPQEALDEATRNVNVILDRRRAMLLESESGGTPQ